MGYIQVKCTGPVSNNCWGRWIIRWGMISKKFGGKILSNLHMMYMMSACISRRSDFLTSLVHNFMKNLDSATNGSTTWPTTHHKFNIKSNNDRLTVILTTNLPDGEGTVEWKQGRDVVAEYDSHDSSSRISYSPASSHTGLYFLQRLRDTSHNSSTWRSGSSDQASRCKEPKASFSSPLSAKNVFWFPFS